MILTQKSVAALYTNIKYVEDETRKTIPFVIIFLDANT